MKRQVFALLIAFILLLSELVAQKMPELIPYRKGKKWGFCDLQKKIIIPCEYDEVLLFSDDVAFVKIGKKWGAIDPTGRKILDFKYDEVRKSFANDVAYIKQGKEYLWIDKKGQKATPPKENFYSSKKDDLEREIEDFALNKKFEKVEQNENLALKEIGGKLITPYKYKCIEDFKEGMAKVATSARYYFNGEENIKVCDKFGFIDSKGKEVIPCKYDYACDFKFGITALRTYPDTINKETGEVDWSKVKNLVLDKKGKELFSIPFQGITFISEDSLLALIESTGIIGVYDLQGKAIIPLNQYEQIDFYYLDLAGSSKRFVIFQNDITIVTKNGKKGVFSKKKQEIIPCEYDLIFIFDNDFVYVKKNQKWGVFDSKGKEILPCKYENIGLVESDRITVTLNEIFMNNASYVDSRGRIFTKLEYLKGLFWVKENNVEGFMDTKGNKFWE